LFFAVRRSRWRMVFLPRREHRWTHDPAHTGGLARRIRGGALRDQRIAWPGFHSGGSSRRRQSMDAVPGRTERDVLASYVRALGVRHIRQARPNEREKMLGSVSMPRHEPVCAAGLLWQTVYSRLRVYSRLYTKEDSY
jgi:hypothetical protein